MSRARYCTQGTKKQPYRSKTVRKPLKRTTGIEPAFPAWKAGALAIVLHPHDLIVLASLPIAAGGIEPSTSRV